MRYKYLGLVCVLMSFYAKAQVFDWATKISSPSTVTTEVGYSITADSSGFSYSTGTFEDTVDFDPGPGIYNLYPDKAHGAYLQKLDSTGNLVWAKTFGGGNSYTSAISHIVYDSLGYLYLTGRFRGLCDFDPDTGTHFLSSTYMDVFIMKLSLDGELIWCKSLRGDGNTEWIGTPVFDNNRNLYISGNFKGTIDLNPDSLLSNSFTTSTSNDAFYIAKLDSNGNYLWGGVIEKSSGTIALDDSANVFCFGNFFSQTDFDIDTIDTHTLQPDGTTDLFLLKLDSSGDFKWAKNMGGNNARAYARFLKIGINDEIYVDFDLDGTIDIDPGPNTINIGQNNFDMGCAKFNKNGNYIWHFKILTGTDGFDLDEHDNIYFGGKFGYTVDFDPGPATYNLTYAAPGFDNYIVKLDKDKNFMWAVQFNNDDELRMYKLAYSSFNQSIYLTGFFEGTTDFDFGVNTFNMTGYNWTSFTSKIKTKIPVGIDEQSNQVNTVSVYPNPTNANVQIELPTEYEYVELDLFNNLGQHIEKSIFNRVKNIYYEFIQPKGIYLLQISTADGIFTSKLVRK